MNILNKEAWYVKGVYMDDQGIGAQMCKEQCTGQGLFVTIQFL